MNKNNKKTILIVGGSGGIGSEIIKTIRSKKVKILSPSDREMNLLNDASVKKAMKKILLKHGAIDVVVFSVSLPLKNKSILNMRWRDFEDHIDLQCKGLFSIMQNLKNQIMANHKTKFIIILTEYCIGKPPNGLADYITAKYSLMGLSKCMAAELAKYNSTVNMVSPGMVYTGLISFLPPKLIEITAGKNPLKRLATPKDVANVVKFLSSDEADYLNGVNVTVNGGGVML